MLPLTDKDMDICNMGVFNRLDKDQEGYISHSSLSTQGAISGIYHSYDHQISVNH